MWHRVVWVSSIHSYPVILFFITLHSDVTDIKFVINYDYPKDAEDYVHRIGRTGRRDYKVCRSADGWV